MNSMIYWLGLFADGIFLGNQISAPCGTAMQIRPTNKPILGVYPPIASSRIILKKVDSFLDIVSIVFVRDL